jgi:Ca2+-transporting ATPase
MTWGQCSTWSGFGVTNVGFGEAFSAFDFGSDPCSYFQKGKVKASTLSLTVLVIIEMLNALNALSEDGSLLQMPPWKNMWLVLAICSSTLIHFVILYVPFLNKIFAVCPLDEHDWLLVMIFSFPVILIDEILKTFGRLTTVEARKRKKNN